MYNGSGNLGETMVFGRISGQNAALRAQDQFAGETKEAITWQGTTNESAGDAMVAGPYTDGTYEGTGAGFMGDIVVSVTITGGQIAGIEIVSDVETDNIGGAALPAYCDAVVASQDLDIDVVSGASNTLRGFKEAINDALSKAVG